MIGCTVADLEHRMTAREFWCWAEVYRLDPWGQERDDLRVAHQTAHLLTPHARKGRSIKVRDCLLQLTPARLDPHEVERKAFRWLKRSGAKVKHAERRDTQP